ncbi:MAG TPA: YbaK/EbsC family protein [Anaerolineae bacterium]|nr:YbaK/EbsC family protein [Anaerolineae bacterium]
MAKKKSATTLAMRALDEKGIEYEPLPQARKQFTAEGVAADLNVPVAWVVKAMIVQSSSHGFALFVVPGDRHLSLKAAGAALGDKNVMLAAQRDVERVTGYQVGAVSVLGYRRDDVPSYVDEGVLALERVVISSGRPDMGLALDPDDLVRALQATVGEYAY